MKIMKRVRWMNCLAMFCLAWVGTCTASEFQCPPKIQLAEARIAARHVSPPFKGLVSESPLWLTGASAYDGPPEEGASLKPSKIKTTGKVETSTWTLEKSTGRSKWVSCDYADGLAHLTAQVDDHTTFCQAMASRGRHQDVAAIVITCR